MDNDNLSSSKKLDNDDIIALSEANDDDIPEVTLCKFCTQIFSENSYERWSKFWHFWEKVHDGPSDSFSRPGLHHQSLQSMKESADQGCYICSRLIEEGYSESEQFPLKYSLRALTEHERESVEGDHRLAFRGDHYSVGHGTFDIRLKSPLTTLRQLAYRSKCRTYTGNDDTFRIAKFWLNECLTTHESCSKRLLDGWKPSRLLDVSENKIKLVLGNSEETRQHPYVTLSHCWGTRPFSVLNATSMPRYIEGVDMGQFEPTFQDVIKIVRRLGVRYLWIDCYCIIQGSEAEAVADWKYESLRMGHVYANGLLNIGALDSDGPSHGIFLNRTDRSINGRMIWSSTQQSGSRSFYIIPEAERTGLWLSFTDLHFSRLLKRGWVLQECVLAPRMLSYGDQVFWQCSELAASEVSPDGALLRSPGDDSKRSTYHPFWMLEDPSTIKQSSTSDFRAQWMRTFRTYCESSLTYPEKDAFVALDGVGTELLKVSGGLFMYGIWDSTLLETLPYSSYLPVSGLLPPTRNRTRPSWHWSSCYPNARYLDDRILNDSQTANKRRSSPMAYAFMSNDCTPLPDECSKDLWPTLLLIGRLLAEIPETRCHELATLEDVEDVSSGKALSYIPIIYERELRHERSTKSSSWIEKRTVYDCLLKNNLGAKSFVFINEYLISVGASATWLAIESNIELLAMAPAGRASDELSQVFLKHRPVFSQLQIPTEKLPIICEAVDLSPSRIQIMLQHGLDLMFEDEGGRSLMNHAISREDSLDLVLGLNLGLSRLIPFPWHMSWWPLGSMAFLRSRFKDFSKALPQDLLRKVLNLEPEYGRNPLCEAASIDTIDIIENCLLVGSDIDFEGYSLGSALMVASACGNLNAVRFLISCNASTHYVGANGSRDCLTLAATDHIRKWLLVGRFAERSAIEEAGNSSGLTTDESSVKPWGGVAQARLLLCGKRERRLTDSSIDYAKRLSNIKREWRGRLAPVGRDGLFYHNSGTKASKSARFR
ncbi:heterokaryon incompatibility protein-domain-containing protein [Xylaria arbuscula]|nr:heterokaryon incompatibility protein-domain-containing protein [Xylaria arbuscula]